MTELSRATAEGMQQAFSDLFFAAMQGELKSLGDYVQSFINSVQRSLSNMLAQMATEGLINGLKGLVPTTPQGQTPVGSGGSGPVVTAMTMSGSGGNGKIYLPSFNIGGMSSDDLSKLLQRKDAGTPPPQFSIDKFAARSADSNLHVEVVNPPGYQHEVSQVTPHFDINQMVVRIIMKEGKANPAFRNFLMSGGRF